MVRELKIKIETLTPLWTGGARIGKMKSLYETGIIGGLRWWYEAVVRGLEGVACDPVEHHCPDKNGCYCDACYFFGATGLKRTFSINWDREILNKNSEKSLTVKVNNNRGWFLNRGLIQKIEGKFFATRYDPIISNDEALNIIALILKLQAQWGGIGAKCQHGYGVIAILEMSPKLNVKLGVSAIIKIIKRDNRPLSISSDNLPNLNEFFFMKVRFDSPENLNAFLKARISSVTHEDELQWYLKVKVDNGNKEILPIAPIVRYHLRKLIRENIRYNGHPNAPARWKLMGVLNGSYHKEDFGKARRTNFFWYCPECKEQWLNKPNIQEHRKKCKGKPTKGYECLLCKKNIPCDPLQIGEMKRQASNIHISHAYRVDSSHFEFRIWGWIPSELPGGISRDNILKLLKRWVGFNNEVPKKPKFYFAKNGELWDSNNLDIKSLNPQITYMEKDQNETGVDFICKLIS